MNTQRKYRCRKCGIDMPAGPYIAPEMCGACQLAANAEIARKAKGEHDLLKQLRRRPYSNPSFWMLEAADEIERLKAAIRSLRNSWPCERWATLSAICRDHPCVNETTKEVES